MATIDQLKNALVLADQAGDFENASILAAAIREFQSVPQKMVIPPRPGEKEVEARKPTTFKENVVAGAETTTQLITGATTGALGYGKGLYEGILQQISNVATGGDWSNKDIEQSAMKAMERFSYSPQSEAGKRLSSKVMNNLSILML